MSRDIFARTRYVCSSSSSSSRSYKFPCIVLLDGTLGPTFCCQPIRLPILQLIFSVEDNLHRIYQLLDNMALYRSDP